MNDPMIDMKPRHVADVEMEVVDGEVLLYHPRHTRAFYLNPTAAIIWALCDGNRSVRDIIDVIGQSYPEASANLPADVLATLNELRESGVLVTR